MSMTLDEMKLAVCEKLPKMFCQELNCNKTKCVESWRKLPIYWQGRGLVNWPTEGLQVCHEAEKLLKGLPMCIYVDELTDICGTEAFPVLIHATYEQRLEALCRVWFPERF